MLRGKDLIFICNELFPYQEDMIFSFDTFVITLLLHTKKKSNNLIFPHTDYDMLADGGDD